MKTFKLFSILALLSFSAGAFAKSYLIAGRATSMSTIVAARQSIENLQLKIKHEEEECAEAGKNFRVLHYRDLTVTRNGSIYTYSALAKVECE